MALVMDQDHPNPNQLLVPCTKSGDVSCQLLEHRTAINKVLLDIGLEIREDHRQLGGVRMAVSPTPLCSRFFGWEPQQWLETSSMNLAHDMIASHRCFTALEVYATTPWPKRVRRALKRRSAVKTLTVYLVVSRIYFTDRRGYNAKFHEGVFALVSSLTSLKELAFKSAWYPLYNFVAPACGQLLGQSLRHMTKLDACNVLLGPKNVIAFFWALTDNRSVTDFAVNWGVLRNGLTGPAQLGSLYLPRRLAALKKFTLTGCQDCADLALWRRLTTTFAEMAKLEELYVKMFIEVEYFTTVCEGFAQVVLRCNKLRRLQLPTSVRSSDSKLLEYDDRRWPQSLIDALRVTRALSDLYISVAGMGKTQLHSLFVAVQSNKALKNVVIWDGLHTYNAHLNLQLLNWLNCEETLDNRVSFEQGLIVDELPSFPELGSFKFLRLIFCLQFRCSKEFLTCCRILCHRGARTEIEVSCLVANETNFGDWLTWLAESSALTHVEVIAFCNVGIPWPNCTRCAGMHSRVVSALARNSSIVKLKLEKFKLEIVHLDAFCQNALKHRSLGKFVLTPGCWTSDPLCFGKCNRLSQGLDMKLFQLQDVVRRNASRMNAAVKFVLGEETGAGASAIEELHDHQRLPERVRDDGGLTFAEAEEKVKLTASRVRSIDVHDFLWLTGVVRERRATRVDPNAQGLHILDLPYVYWSYIRAYLKIADVVSG